MKPYRYLTDDQVLAIHNATLRVLEDTGIQLDHIPSLELVLANGARQVNGMVRLPAAMVEACLSRKQPEVILQGRGSMVSLGSGALHVHNLGGARDVFDPQTGQIRPASAADVAESTRLMDALGNVTTITPLYTPRDVPAEKMTLTMFADTAKNTLKPVNGPGVHNAQEVQLLVEMIKVVFGDRPSVSLGVSPVSPLNFLGHVAPVIMEIAKSGLPLGPLPCPSVGATSPMSLAGSLVQQNAENLATIVLARLVNPETPIVYCGRLSVINMRSGAPIWGNPEVGMMSAATVQLGHYYHLPVNVYGLAASGYAPDIQSGYERAINALVPALAGADELSGVGEMAGGAQSCNAQILIDNDIYGMIQRVLRGFVIDEDSLAVEVIAHAMSGSHNFLSEKHTRKYLHAGEVWTGKLAVQEVGWEMWKKVGSPNAIVRAQAEVDQLLANHKVEPLSEDQERALDEILESI